MGTSDHELNKSAQDIERLQELVEARWQAWRRVRNEPGEARVHAFYRWKSLSEELGHTHDVWRGAEERRARRLRDGRGIPGPVSIPSPNP